jgi:hypothetical protein
MRFIAAFFAFWYDFIIGDDWTVAAGVVIALIVTGLLVLGGFTVWWLMPLVVLVLLGASVQRVARATGAQ